MEEDDFLIIDASVLGIEIPEEHAKYFVGPSREAIQVYGEPLEGYFPAPKEYPWGIGIGKAVTRKEYEVITKPKKPPRVLIRLLEEYIRLFTKIHGLTYEEPKIIYKKPEKILRPRPIIIDPPPWLKYNKVKISRFKVRLHILFDISSSAYEFFSLYKDIRRIILGLVDRLETYSDRIYKYRVCRRIKPNYPNLNKIIGRTFTGIRYVNSLHFIDNLPVKLYPFSDMAFEVSIIKTRGRRTKLVSPKAGGGTNPIGALALLEKNILVDEYSLEVSEYRIINRPEIVLLISDLLFNDRDFLRVKEFFKSREYLPVLIITNEASFSKAREISRYVCIKTDLFGCINKFLKAFFHRPSEKESLYTPSYISVY